MPDPQLFEEPPADDQFTPWWHGHIDRHAPEIAAKAAAYGSHSLMQMGKILARSQGREIDDTEALELGCFLYAYGKMERVADAVIRGERPSRDTWHDLGVYATMALYIRQHRRWP